MSSTAGAPGCLFCGSESVSSKYYTADADSGSRAWSNWKSSCGRSLCTLLALPANKFFTQTLAKGSYCYQCAPLVWDADFTCKQLAQLEKRMASLQKCITSKLNTHGNRLENGEGADKSPVKRILEEMKLKGHQGRQPPLDSENSDGEDARHAQVMHPRRMAAQKCQKLIKKMNSPSSEPCPTTPPPMFDEIIIKIENEEAKASEVIMAFPFSTESEDEDYDPLADTDTEEPIKLHPTSHKRNPSRRKSKQGLVPAPCSQCDEICRSDSALKYHIRTKHPEARHDCPLCHRYFKQKLSFDRHMTDEHNLDYTHRCRVCTQGFRNLEELAAHELTHNSATPFQCSQCFTVCTNSHDLRRHVQEHENAHKCSRCPKSFTNTAALAKHTKRHEVHHTCDICGVGFFQKRMLDRHQNTVHASANGRAFQCEECPSNFKDIYSLRRHKVKHSDKRPFACTQCDKTFRQRQTLMGHEETHSGIRPYVCPTCGRAFGARQNLWAHERTHNPNYKAKPRNRARKAQQGMDVAGVGAS